KNLINELRTECQKAEVPIVLTARLGAQDCYLALGTNGELCQLQMLCEMNLIEQLELDDADDIKIMAFKQSLSSMSPEDVVEELLKEVFTNANENQ
ncbi:MAG: hypothetical protein RR492_08340, partial [Enterococcus sp.]